MHKLLLSLLILLSVSVNAQQADTLLPLVPQPVQAKRMAGTFPLRDNMPVVAPPGVKSSDAVLFIAFVESFYGIHLKLVNKHTGAGAIRISYDLEEDKTKPADYYELKVSASEIKITGKGSGVFYGLQTLIQLIPAGIVKEYNIPCVNISDYPRFAWRGMHLDVSRHFFKKEEVKKYIDFLAMYKLNVFHWHLTDDQGWRIEIKSRPKLTEKAAWRNGTLIGHYTASPQKFDTTRYGGFYTQDEVREIIAYAQQRHITVVPEIELPGHSLATLSAYPELGCTPGPFEAAKTWGVFNDVLCPKEETFKFLEDVFKEVCALFPGQYIHIGGDECPKDRWKESALCQEIKKRENLKDEHELQSWFIRRVEKIVAANNKQIIGWDEILEGGLAPGAAVMSWRGDEGGIAAAREKHNVVMSPTSNFYFDYYQSESHEEPLAIGGYLPLEKVYGYNPLPAALKPEEQQYIMGVQANLWTEYIGDFRKVEYMALPRMAALAEVAWSQQQARNYERFVSRLTTHLLVHDRMGTNYSKAIFYIEPQILPPLPGKPGVRLVLNTRSKGAVIRYSVAETFNENSPPMEDTLNVMRAMSISAAAFEGPIRRSPVYRQNFQMTYSTGKPITLLTQPDPKYNNGGGFTLVNGVAGRMPWNGAEWLGYKDSNLEAVIDLGKTSSFNRVRVDVLKDEGSWIYQPKSIEVLTSNDGITFTSVKKIGSEDIQQYVRMVMVNTGMNFGRYVKIVIEPAGTIPAGKPGEGNPAWLFVDEIFIE